MDYKELPWFAAIACLSLNEVSPSSQYGLTFLIGYVNKTRSYASETTGSLVSQGSLLDI